MISWLASYPKSGNTWARMVIAAYKNYSHLDINEPGHCVSDGSAYFWQAVAPVPIEKLSDYELMLLRPAVLCHITRFRWITPLIVKTHSINAIVDGVNTIPSKLTQTAVVIVRDPRDVAISYANHFGKSISEAIDVIANDSLWIGKKEYGPHLLGSWSRHIRSWLHPLDTNEFPVMVFRYEDLLENPFKEFKEMLEWYHIEVDDWRLKRAIEVTSFAALQMREQEDGFREKSKHADTFFTHGTAGHWREMMTEAQADKVADTQGEMMTRFKYLDAEEEAA